MIDWAEIANKFQTFKTYWRALELPSKDIVEMHKAHLLTGGLVNTKLLNPYYESHYLYPGADVWMERRRLLMQDFKIGYPTWKNNVYSPGGEWVTEIEKAINGKTISAEFIDAWHYLGMIIGRSSELDEMHEIAQKRFNQDLKSGIESNNDARKCWYAHCLTDRKSTMLKSISRTDAEIDIHKIIIDLLSGLIESPINPRHYNKNWFGRIVVNKKTRYSGKNGQSLDDFDLSESFTRMEEDEIEKYRNHRFITPAVLPPLHRSKFIRSKP